MNKSIIIQDAFLNQVRRSRVLATIHLANGYQLKGYVKGFDNFVVVLQSEDKQQLIYKHAISTITPAQPIDYYPRDESRAEI